MLSWSCFLDELGKVVGVLVLSTVSPVNNILFICMIIPPVVCPGVGYVLITTSLNINSFLSSVKISAFISSKPLPSRKNDRFARFLEKNVYGKGGGKKECRIICLARSISV